MGDCSAVVLKRVPEKLSDPGVFAIPVLFGSDAISHALADLGASINLMPYSLYEKLELGELTPTRMSLSLADRSVKYPRGIIENLLVKVDKFVFPVDFVVLDMEANEKVPIILSRPLLRTAKALIDVCFDYICGADLVGSNGLVECDDLGEDELCENNSVCDELAEISGLLEMIEVNEISFESEAGPEEKPAPLELKVLPSHLEYAHLDEGSNLPVIVSSKLTEDQKTKLIDVLKLHKGAIAWRLSDTQGISPSYCTHRILMEDEYKPVVQPQRRLNPNMQEVVNKEVLKLMDAGMIYPISDPPWVSLTQVVPKKGGIVLGHKISRDGIEVDRAKIDTISILPPPTNVKAIRSFLGLAGFYRRFIKDFSKITRPMTRLLEKDVPFVFDDECVKAFTYFKEKLVSAPILCSPDWSLPFELMCDASDYAKKDPKPRLIRWIPLLSEFDIEIKDKKGAENVAADHLSRLEDPRREELREEEIGDTFPHESIDFFAAEKQGKLKSKWSGPYLVKEVYPYGVVELENPDNGTSWKVNDHRLKHYLGGPKESIEREETPLDPSH
ncbi:uncharacterized protein LOC143577464 [Bidens hawaiensis]|uniref:uncharacterized protein LOC143577464 n=1 Tax=Bidens hawaiensis TaxID=980011 RepID=UPI00404B0D7F